MPLRALGSALPHRVVVEKLLRMLDNQACPPLSLVVLCGPIDQAVMVGQTFRALHSS